jgi:hypothetical protein
MWPTFPIFKGLSLLDKDSYERLLSKHAPFSDLSFTTLHIWWNLSEELAISTLNNNVVIDYRNPIDLENSGLCLVGIEQPYESMQLIFEYLERRQDTVRLVHIPEFVTSALTIAQKQELNIIEELDYNEYIIDSSELSKLADGAFGKVRRKVRRCERELENKQTNIKQLDLSEQANRDLIYESIVDWQTNYPKANDPANSENQALLISLRNYECLKINNLCLFVDGQLQAVCLFHKSHDDKYYILNHLKVDYATPFIFDYMTHLVASLAVKNHVPYINMEMDLGVAGLRQHKMGLRPIEFFRKYTISPKQKLTHETLDKLETIIL